MASVTPEIEDRLLELWELRRQLSEKALCAKYGIARSTLRNAIRRAQTRRWYTLPIARAEASPL